MAKVICDNCGAYFEEMESKCPHCGYISIPGAEKKYMEDVHQVETDMTKIPEIQKKKYFKAFSGHNKVIAITVSIFFVIMLIVVGILFAFNKWEESTYHFDTRAQLLWERDVFPQMDELYEKEDYDGLVEFYYALYNDKANEQFSIFAWEHYGFLDAYEKYAIVMGTAGLLEKGEEISQYEYKNAVYYAMWYHYNLGASDVYECVYTDKELELIELYREDVEKVFTKNLKFTLQEADELYEKCMEKGYFDVGECYEYTGKKFERFK